ncbi:MAG: chorismate-binding protein [Candidatus Levybacteria bacterium]|nr:chorismate-binding protein [Candidatus Levybacteria bacterium]
MGKENEPVMPVTVEKRIPKEKYSLSLEEFRDIVAREKKDGKEEFFIPIFRTLASDFDTPGLLYDRLTKDDKERKGKKTFFPTVLLESVAHGVDLGRWSYVCVDPKEEIRVTENEISEVNSNGKVTTRSGERIDPLKAIEEKVSKPTIETPGLPPFTGGCVGYVGYEAASAFEEKVPKSNPDVLGIPEAVLYEFDTVIAFDHAKNEMKVVGNIHVGDHADLDNLYNQATSRIDGLVDRINAPVTIWSKAVDKPRREREVKSNFTKEEYMEIVRRAREYIMAGDIIQVVPSQRWAVETDANPFDIYRASRRGNPSPFMFYFDTGDFQLIGASPELLLKVEDRTITTYPLAGTRPRGKPEEDARLEHELKTDEKERAEHIMLVDLARNDIGRVARPGSVKVPKLMEVSYFPTIMHLGSVVTGELADDKTPFDAFRSNFPVGTVSGAPKIRAMQIVNELEKERRGAYAGAFGYFAYGGNIEAAIAIRTMVHIPKEERKIENPRFKERGIRGIFKKIIRPKHRDKTKTEYGTGGTVYLQAGGGVVFDSDPETEYNETVAKRRGSLGAIRSAEEEY